MARKLVKRTPDDRIQRALDDPKTYFDQARERAFREVVEEMAKARKRSRAHGLRHRVASS